MAVSPPTWSARRRRLVLVSLAVVPLGLIACSGSADEGAGDASGAVASTAAPVVPGWPSAIAAIGHSGLTGYDSDAPGQDARGNSWATGDNPDVDSVYLRILAENPAIEGHATNLAVDGSGVADLLRQAEQITEADPKPELVLVQSIDNDIQCDGTDAQNLPLYREGLVDVMDTLTGALPDATILFVDQWASVAAYDAAAMARDPAHLAGDGLCDVVDPTTLKVVPEKEAALQTLVDEYFATIKDVCAQYANCITDEGAMQNLALATEDITPDFNHLTVSGHAKMAAIAWDVLYSG